MLQLNLKQANGERKDVDILVGDLIVQCYETHTRVQRLTENGWVIVGNFTGGIAGHTQALKFIAPHHDDVKYLGIAGHGLTWSLVSYWRPKAN